MVPSPWTALHVLHLGEKKGVKMKNIGKFKPSWKPVKAGGLTKSDIAQLEKKGWRHEKTCYDAKGVDLGFLDTAVPSRFVIYKVNVPKGTEYMYHPAHGGAIIKSGGNPTCWRQLL